MYNVAFALSVVTPLFSCDADAWKKDLSEVVAKVWQEHRSSSSSKGTIKIMLEFEEGRTEEEFKTSLEDVTAVDVLRYVWGSDEQVTSATMSHPLHCKTVVFDQALPLSKIDKRLIQGFTGAVFNVSRGLAWNSFHLKADTFYAGDGQEVENIEYEEV